MGYTTKDIAVIFEPKRVSLAALPNFVQFASKVRIQSAYKATIKILVPTKPLSLILITEPSGAVHSFTGSADINEAGGSVYFIAPDAADTAENLRQALLSDAWVSANFSIDTPATWDGAHLHNGTTLEIVSLGFGADFNIVLNAPNDPGHAAYQITIVNGVSHNGDSISGEATTAEISLDVYVDAPIFLGADDKPTSAVMLGTFAVSLSKTYSGDTLWFDLNSPFSKYGAYNLPPDAPGWFNTGTLRVFRFVARVAAVNNFAFYQSNALYVLRGYGVASDPIDLEDYVYDVEKIKLLTNKPRTIYVRGQREYLNFMFSDEDHGKTYAPDWTVKVVYRAYSTTDKFLGEGFSDQIKRSDLNMVNTCILRIDDVLDQFPTAGIIRVALARGNAIISSDLEYIIRPAALHTLNQFSFLNRLGGWDSFNFDAAASEDIKVTFDTFSKTVTPGYVKGEGVETVYASDLDATQTVVGAPITDEVAEWLKELAASTVVLDSDGKQIIKTEFTATLAEGATNMQVPTMKWRPSETYNNE